MLRMAGALPPEVGVAIANRREAENDRIRRAARRQGSDEPRAAHMADVLVKLLSGQGGGKAVSADLVIVCDLPGLAPETVVHLAGAFPPSSALLSQPGISASGLTP